MEIFMNGKSMNISGKGNIIIQNGRIIVDGNTIQSELTGNIDITINGDVNNINCTGSVTIHGNVMGNIDCGGSCNCGDVSGDVDCGGSCNCGNVKGNLDAGGSVRVIK